MNGLDGAAWLAIAAVGATLALSMLYALATLFRDQTAIFDLHSRVHRLRREYDAQVQNVVMEDDPEIARLALEQVGGAAPQHMPATNAA